MTYWVAWLNIIGCLYLILSADWLLLVIHVISLSSSPLFSWLLESRFRWRKLVKCRWVGEWRMQHGPGVTALFYDHTTKGMSFTYSVGMIHWQNLKSPSDSDMQSSSIIFMSIISCIWGHPKRGRQIQMGYVGNRIGLYALSNGAISTRGFG